MAHPNPFFVSDVPSYSPCQPGSCSLVATPSFWLYRIPQQSIWFNFPFSFFSGSLLVEPFTDME
jgi:hypothetical protein